MMMIMTEGLEPTDRNDEFDIFAAKREKILIPADVIHRRDMRHPAYALRYLAGWPKNQLEIALLRRRAR